MSRQKDPAVFCRSLEWQREIKWFDRVGYIQLDVDRRIKIELTSGTSEQFSRFTVSLISKTKGPLDAKTFRFQDYLDAEKRKDDRPDHTGEFYVYPNSGWEWYIAIPASTRPLCAAIEEWITLYT